MKNSFLLLIPLCLVLSCTEKKIVESDIVINYDRYEELGKDRVSYISAAKVMFSYPQNEWKNVKEIRVSNSVNDKKLTITINHEKSSAQSLSYYYPDHFGMSKYYEYFTFDTKKDYFRILFYYDQFSLSDKRAKLTLRIVNKKEQVIAEMVTPEIRFPKPDNDNKSFPQFNVVHEKDKSLVVLEKDQSKKNLEFSVEWEDCKGSHFKEFDVNNEEWSFPLSNQYHYLAVQMLNSATLHTNKIVFKDEKKECDQQK